MKKIEAVILSFKLNEVAEALTSVGIENITAIDVKCCHRDKNAKDHIARWLAGDTVFHPKTKIEFIVEDEKVEAILALLTKTARTGNTDDGNITLLGVEKMVLICNESEAEETVA